MIMKELSIKEKAKAYDEAIERAKKWRNAPNADKIPTYASRVVDEIFPELAESEEEKKTKESLMQYIWDMYHKDFYPPQPSIERCDKWLAWLEKQGEQKPNPYTGTSFEYNGHNWGMCARDNGIEILFDGELKAFLSSEKSFIYPIHPQPYLAPKSASKAIKEKKVDNQNCIKSIDNVEPKFKVGDWILINVPCKVKGIDKYGNYIVEYIDSDNKETYVLSKNYCESYFRLWTIKDAKDGDVLAFKDGTSGVLIYKDYLNEVSGVFSHCRIIRNSFIDKEESGWGPTLLSPATKEQRTLLFQKMREGGYEWDVKKKELTKIENKSSWNEEDEKNISQAIYVCHQHGYTGVEKWLKSLRPQNRDIYNPYKEVVSSIAEMCDKYKSFSDDRANDFVNNVKVKCKDAKEYDSLYNDLKK